MIKPAPPISNIERQRQFRERNPGYFKRYNARKKAIAKKAKAAVAAYRAAIAQAEAAAATAPATPAPLLLPAPAQTIDIPGMTTIPTRSALNTLPTPEPAPLQAQPTPPSPAASPLAA